MLWQRDNRAGFRRKDGLLNISLVSMATMNTSTSMRRIVMPHSALRTGQHMKWRGGNYKRKGGPNSPSIGLNLRIHEPWDLANIEPDFFPMPGSVVFAEYTGAGQGAPLAPGTIQVWRGDWQEDYAGISRKSEALHHDDGKFKSPYAELSSQGPTIFDRRLFFVETIPNKVLIQATNTTNIKPRLGNQDNILYEGQLNLLEGVISNNHLFDVYLGECIAPYVALDPLKAALPVHRTTMTMPMSHHGCEDGKHDACQLEVEALHFTMQKRWNNAVEMYHAAHKNQAIQGLYNRLNHHNILTSQLGYLQHDIAGAKTVRVAYTTAGQPTATIIKDNHAIVESKLYQTECYSNEEAHYILAILNSRNLEEQTEVFRPKGLYGARDFHKHGWKLPIPSYEDEDPLHVQLSQLGKTAEKECATLIMNSDIMTKTAGKTQSDPARKLLRHEWQPNSTTAQEIETAVAKLLSDSAQAKLAEKQMQTA